MKNNNLKLKISFYTFATFFVFLSFFFIFIYAQAAPSWLDPNSPLALKLHPRLFFIPQSYRDSNPNAFGYTIEEMRQRLASDYQTEFQAFIDTIDNSYNISPSNYISTYGSLESYYMTFDIFNYGFLYLLDPAIMKSRYGFTFEHTKSEYGQKAVSLTDYVATKVFTSVPNNDSQPWISYSLYVKGNNANIVNISLGLAVDWFPELLNNSLKNKIADAIIHLYSIRKEPEGFFHRKQIGRARNGDMGVLALYGENFTDTTISDKLVPIIDSFKKDWIDDTVGLWNLVNENGSYSFSSSGDGYFMIEALMHILQPTYIMSTVLNQNYFVLNSYIGESIYKSIYTIEPFPIDGFYHFIASGDTNWRVPDKVTSSPDKLLRYYPSIGPASKDDTKKASVAKWMKDISKYPITRNFPKSEEYIKTYYPFALFFLDDKSVVARSPSQLNLPLSKDVGGRQYLMRTGFESNSDSLVTFWPRKYHGSDGGHGHRDFGNFEIQKYGKLLGHRQISKGFCSGTNADNKKLGDYNMWYNTIGVYNPAELDEDGLNDMGYRGGYIDYKASIPNFKNTFNQGGANYVGDVLKEDLNSLDYDYVSYDNRWAWNSAKVDYSTRQFVYLRTQGGEDDEYVILLDKINSTDPTFKKRFILHPIGNPELVNENWTSLRDGKWQNNNSDIIKVTGNYSGSHGRLFSKTLAPSNTTIYKLGGPGRYFEDAAGTLLHDGGSCMNNDLFKYIYGEYSIWVESEANQNYDNFLNVMQFGDSNTLSSMNSTTKIDGNTMIGTLINDPTTPRIVLFSKDPRGASVNNVNYTANYSSSKTGKHLLVDITPGIYDIYKNGTRIYSNKIASSQGVLTFSSTGGSTFQVTQSGSPPPPPPPPSTCTSFTYSAWGSCQPDNTQTRTVTSSLPSGCTGGNPITTQSCVYTPPPPLTLPGDLNQDGAVNSLDWSIMNSAWGTADATSDINNDGIVNTIDFSIMNGNWGK